MSQLNYFLHFSLDGKWGVKGGEFQLKKVLVRSALALLFVGFTYALDSSPVTATPVSIPCRELPNACGGYFIQAPLQHFLDVMSMGEQPSSAFV
jgi:hypothetical protein